VQFATKGFVSLKPPDDPYTIELPRALELIQQKKIADANKLIQDFGVDNIKVLNGRYGPYITDGKRNARIPKDADPKTIALDLCRELLAAAPPRGSRFGRKKAPTPAAKESAAAPAAAEIAASAKPAKKSASKPAHKAAPAVPAAKPEKKPSSAKKKSAAHPHASAKSAPAPSKKSTVKRKKS
jgi:DNA topoisomerase-1